MLRRSGRGLVIVLVGELWAPGTPGLPTERRKRRDSRLSAGNAGTADRAPGLPGQPLERQKLSFTPAGGCVYRNTSSPALIFVGSVYLQLRPTDLRVLL